MQERFIKKRDYDTFDRYKCLLIVIQYIPEQILIQRFQRDNKCEIDNTIRITHAPRVNFEKCTLYLL